MKTPYMFRKVSKFGRWICNRFKGLEEHYLLIIPLKIKKKKVVQSLRSACKSKIEYCNFGFMGKRCLVYTNGFTEHLKPMIPLIKDKILEDCQRNPAYYLYGRKGK